MKKSKLNPLGVVIIIIFLPILIINTILIIKSYVHPDEVPSVFGIKPFIVLSGSMEPTIMTGDLAIIKNCDPNELKENDIIAFRNGTSVITHRIIEVTEKDGKKVFLTKGDNNNTEDRNPVSPESVEGIYVSRIPGLGDFAMFLQTTAGSIIFISIPFILFILTEAAQRRKESKYQAEKQKKLEKELEELKKEKSKVDYEKI